VTDGVAQHRLRDERGVDDVVSALHAQLEFLHSHPAAGIERVVVALES
jgi:hypothetical protein